MKIILILILTCIHTIAFAATFNSAKTAILVDNTNAQDPLKFKQAFAQIIANNTGERITTILNNSAFATTNIKVGVKRFYFEKIDYSYLSPESNYHYWFYLVMKKDFIDKVVRQSGFSVLPNKREKTMLWAVVETVENETLDYAYDADKISYWLNHWALAHGINMVNPSMDEQDKMAVMPQAIKTLAFDAIKQSQSRYGINQSLLVYINQSADTIKIRSGFKMAGEQLSIKHFQQSGSNIGELSYELIANIAQIYANKYRIDATSLQQHTLQIVVNGLNNYDDTNKVSKYFNGLSVIQSYTMVSAKVGQMVLTTELSISTQAFLEVLARDRILAPSQNTSINQLVLNYLENN